MAANVLITAMAIKCRSLIDSSCSTESGLPDVLHPKHLLWMCSEIEKHADDWPSTRLHRWIGFIQCGMMANRMLDLAEVKRMFDEAKNAHGGTGPDSNLIDHLNPDNLFELEIGGQG